MYQELALSIVEVCGRFKKNIYMAIAEKIDLAKSNTAFTLFKEGLFYKCYNEDAILFIN